LKITAPFILRRLKTDKSIISDLPDKIENDYVATLVKEQGALYQGVLNTLMSDIKGIASEPKACSCMEGAPGKIVMLW
jgi:SNF2 family DNA or RNA helicase